MVTLRLSQPDRPVVVLDRALLQSIDATLDAILAEGRPAGFVLASDSRVFVAGADLHEIMSLSDAELHEYLSFGQRVYGRIAALPCTTVAAIHGAALGGGLEIAMHCDRLIAALPASSDPAKPAKPYPIGLPEASLGITPGWGGTNMLPARMDPERAIRMTATGQTFTIVDAREAGLIEELVDDPAALAARARAIAAEPKSPTRKAGEPIAVCNAGPRPGATIEHLERVLDGLRGERAWPPAALAVFDCVETGLRQGWKAALDAERHALVRLRNTPEAKAAIHAFFEKSRK